MKLHVSFLLITLIAFVKFHNSVARNSENGLDLLLDYMIKNQNEDDNVIIGNNIKNQNQVNGKTTIHYGGQDYVKYWNKHESPVHTDHLTRQNLNNDNGNRNHYGRMGYVSKPDIVDDPIKTPNNGVTVTRANPNRYRGVEDNRNTNNYQAGPYNRHNNENRYHASNEDFGYEPIKTPNNGVTVTRASHNRYRGVEDNRNSNIHHAGKYNWHNNESVYLA